MEQETKQIKRRLAYRIGDKLPKPIKFIYYLILCLTIVYILYRIVVGVLTAIQKIGAFIFDKKNYWTFLICILILGVGILLASQYIFDLDPFGQFINWFEEQKVVLQEWLSETFETLKEWCIGIVGG